MFSKDSCNFVCELCLMMSGTMFEMVSQIMLYGLVTSTLWVFIRESYESVLKNNNIHQGHNNRNYIIDLYGVKHCTGKQFHSVWHLRKCLQSGVLRECTV